MYNAIYVYKLKNNKRGSFMNDFEKFSLSKEILNSIEKLGYKKPTNVQEKVIPFIMEGKDIIVKSQTGSGKTAAFGIPICENICIEEKHPQAIVLTPTRELCVQVSEDLTNIGRLKRVRSAAIFGKQPFDIQERALKQRVHIVVGTPGRTIDHIARGTLNLENIKYLVIDEADKMLNMGFIDQVQEVIKALPMKRITMLFSATISEEIEYLCEKYMKNPDKIEITPEVSTNSKINQVLYDINENKKFDLLTKLIYLESPDSCIIFCGTKDKVGVVASRMKEKGFDANALHGGMLQGERLDIMKQFKRGEFRFLVATDVAARGIDIENLSLIINYDVPVENESYVHRIGRTGRAGTKGKAVTFLSPEEQRYLTEIEEYIGQKIPRKMLPNEAEVKEAKAAFSKNSAARPKIKKDKGDLLNKDIAKIYLNAGKKKKVRAGDIVGAITSIEGINPEDIGIIDIQDNCSFVDILGGKGDIVLKSLQTKTIKGKSLRVEKAVK